MPLIPILWWWTGPYAININSPSSSATVAGTVNVGFTVTNVYTATGGATLSLSSSATLAVNTLSFSNGPLTITITGSDGQFARLPVYVNNTSSTSSTSSLHFYGVGGHYVQGGLYASSIAQQVIDMQALGMKTIRQDCYSTGDTSRMATLVSSFSPIVIQPVFIVYPSTSGNETTVFNQFHSLGAIVATQLAGKVPVVELQNEPENFYFTGGTISGNGQNITDWAVDQSEWNAFRGSVRGFIAGFRSIDTTNQTLLASPSMSWLHYGILDGLWNGTAPDGSSGHPTARWDLTNQHWYADMGDITNAGNTSTNVLTTLNTLFGVPIILSEVGVQFSESESAIDSYISTQMAFYADNASAYDIASVGWYELYNFDNNSGFYMGLYSGQGTANANRASAMAAVIAANPMS